ncbi:MAG: 16S rRNA (adenine(1518)-N(6)/adenine(1519)-N(6))-dimethyltransferase, partial [Candidatus Dadabacteria bacterium]|nr:16S rRNA (adenine(1518)-N(6)/adenine(1519)-N(6))-dimethyltransferase [Candidatus Dadabacteria bacterium]
GCQEYGRLSVMVQSQCHVEKLFEISPDAFIPPPKVDSAIVKLRVRKETGINISTAEIFASIVRHAFSHR